MTGTFDARIVRKNDSEKGLFLTLEITGDDFYGAVSQFRPGTLLKLQYEELDGDTGGPKEQASAPAPAKVVSQQVSEPAAQQGGEETAALNSLRAGHAEAKRVLSGRDYKLHPRIAEAKEAALNTPAPGAGQPDGGDVDQTDSATTIEKPRQPVDESHSSSRPAKPHRKFSDLPLSQQCAIICAEPAFKIFLEQMYTDGDEIGIVANAVRNLCGVSSRSQLNNGDDPATRWHNLHAEYQSWLTTRSHGDLVR